MKCKLITIILSVTLFNLNPLIQHSVFSDDLKKDNWFSSLENNFKLIGSGNLSFFGINLYKASLFSSPNFDHKYPFKVNFALEIKYFKNFRKEKIANISKKEMNKLNLYKEQDLKIWHEWMIVEFPDISTSDVLTGVFSPTFGLKLFHNNSLIAINNDIEFAKAFFSIWLHKDTSEPALRRKLLGLDN